jgi:group II intron reverse transcriptase/maturase
MGKSKPLIKTDTKLKRIAELSGKDPKMKFNWLMPHFNKENLIGCFRELDGRKAVGIDKQTKEDYATNLESNIEDLINRMKSMSYRPQPVKEVLIPKMNGKFRSLGIACIEDKIVQSMMAKVLGAIYEPLFRNSSYGFRPNRNCHQAVKVVLNQIYGNWCNMILDIDLENYFGSIDQKKLVALLRLKIKDETFIRYVVRTLKSGILTQEGFKRSDEGMAQGSICSPILANIFAHYALDIWFEDVV